jgi:hypothetical protein
VDGAKACWVDNSSSSPSNCIKIAKNVTDNPGIMQLISGLEIGKTYQVDLWGKKGEEATIYVSLGNSQNFEAGTSWTEMTSFTWVATVTDINLTINVMTNTGTNSAYIDAVKVRKLTGGIPGSSLVINGDFEAGITGWTALSGAVLTWSAGVGIDCTVINLTAASDDLTSNLATVQTDHYLLGVSGVTYTVSEARSPKDFGSKTTYLPGALPNYTFKQDTVSGSDGINYKAIQVFVPNDSNIQFRPGQDNLDVPFRFSRSDLAGMTNPANIVNYILLDLGIPSTRIDAASVTAAAAIFTANGLALNVGLYFQQNREKLICKLLAMSNMVLIVRDKIYFKVLTKASQGTMDTSFILPGTFQSSRKVYTQDEKDSGYLLWQYPTEPQDQANKSLIAAKSTVLKPSENTIEVEWIDGSARAKKAAKLALQREILPQKDVSFDAMLRLAAYEPGDMITITGANYDSGGVDYDVQIEQVGFDQKGKLSFQCTKFSAALNDWADLTESDITIYSTDDSKGYSNVVQGPTDSTGNGPNQITGAVLLGDDGQFKTCVSPETTGGFKATNEALTCYDSTGGIRFQAKYAGPDQGDVIGGDYSGGQGFKWDQSTGLFNIAGGVTATFGAIGGWTLAATKFSGTGLEFDSANIWIKAFTGSNSVTISPAGIVGHDNTLGDVFKLFTNGAAPEFSSGIIKECEYQLYTAGIIRTNAAPATNGGFLLNSAKLVGYVAGGGERFRVDLSGTDAGDVTFGDYAGGQGIKWDQSAVLLKIKVTAAGGIEVAGGGDITLAGSNTNPGVINFHGTSYSVQVGGDVDGNRFIIRPNTTDVIDFQIGSTAVWWGEGDTRFQSIDLEAKKTFEANCGDYVGAVNGAYIYLSGNLASSTPILQIGLYDKTAQTLMEYYFLHAFFGPNGHKTQDLGRSADAWDNAYADDWNNVADFFSLDNRKEGGILTPVDDLAVIDGIKPSGVFDLRTGFEIIDDSTLPEWLLSRDKRSGEILRDPDGKPYLSLKTMISLCLGAIRQLSEKIK